MSTCKCESPHLTEVCLFLIEKVRYSCKLRKKLADLFTHCLPLCFDRFRGIFSLWGRHFCLSIIRSHVMLSHDKTLGGKKIYFRGEGQKRNLNWYICSMQCEHNQAPRQRRQKRAAPQRRLTGLNPAGLGGMGDWDRLTGSARGRLSACLYVCMSPRLSGQYPPPSPIKPMRQNDRMEVGGAHRKASTPAVWQTSTGTSGEVWIFGEDSWTPAESQRG